MRGQSGRSAPVIGDAAFSLGSAPPGEPGPGRESEAPSLLRPIPRVNIQAFCEDQDTAAAIERAAQDRRLSRARVSVQMGGIDGACAFYRNAPTPNLIVIESLLDRATMLAELDRLAGLCDPATKVMVVGHLNDVVLYRELLRRGVSEYLVAPVSVLQIIETLSNLYSDPQARPIGQAIALSAPRAARARAPFATTPRLPSPLRSSVRWSSPISISPSARPGSISTRTRRKGSPMRSLRRTVSMR
jgi:hypothetical protein